MAGEEGGGLVRRGCARAHTNSVMSYVCSLIPTNFSWNSGTCFPSTYHTQKKYLHTYGALCTRATSHLHTWESVQTKIVPVPAVPVPTSPEGVIPEVPVPGGFFYRDPTLINNPVPSNLNRQTVPVRWRKKELSLTGMLTHTTCNKKTHTQRCEPPHLPPPRPRQFTTRKARQWAR